jgi:hypothetical protein
MQAIPLRGATGFVLPAIGAPDGVQGERMRETLLKIPTRAGGHVRLTPSGRRGSARRPHAIAAVFAARLPKFRSWMRRISCEPSRVARALSFAITAPRNMVLAG